MSSTTCAALGATANRRPSARTASYSSDQVGVQPDALDAAHAEEREAVCELTPGARRAAVGRGLPAGAGVGARPGRGGPARRVPGAAPGAGGRCVGRVLFT